jgi:hypothetical protein
VLKIQLHELQPLKILCIVNLWWIFGVVQLVNMGYRECLALLETHFFWRTKDSQPGPLVLRGAAKGIERFFSGSRWGLGMAIRAIWNLG